MSKMQDELLSADLKAGISYRRTLNCVFSLSPRIFQEFFCVENDLVHCINSCALMDAVEHEHNTNEWGLFIGASKASSKAVIVHNLNKFPSVTVRLCNHNAGKMKI